MPFSKGSDAMKKKLKWKLLTIAIGMAVLIGCAVPFVNDSADYASDRTAHNLRKAAPVAYVHDTGLAQAGRWEGKGGFTFASHSLEKVGDETIDKESSVALPELESPDRTPDETLNRLVIYNARLVAVVPRIDHAIAHMKALADALGGYMQTQIGRSITLKIPANNFKTAIAEVENLGEVTDRQIKGTDVTEEMQDLQIRLDNAENLRNRYIRLLEKCNTVEETLKVEKQLGRLTEEIETIKGRMQYLQNNVAFSTLTVVFNSPVPQEDIYQRTPFAWVHELTEQMHYPQTTQPNKGRRFWQSSLFDVPDEFVLYFDQSGSAKAMSADCVMISVRKVANYSGGSQTFWSDLARRILVEEKTLHIGEEKELDLPRKRKAKLYIGQKELVDGDYGYLLALHVVEKEVYVFEAWGPLEKFEGARTSLTNTIKTLKS
jgi:hypothetical protein